MATSTNYGWAEPDNSSLVKNGASDIRTLGNAIDTSVWNVGFGQAGKNKIINGDFTINQRNFTSTTTTATFGFDRWQFQCSDGTVTHSTQAFTAGTAPVTGYEATNFARIVTTGQTTTTALAELTQKIENVRTFAGQTATISFWAKAASGTPKIAVEAVQDFGTGGSPSSAVFTVVGSSTISTSWARYSLTIAIPSISGKTVGTAANTSSLAIRLFVSAGSAYNSRTGSLGIQTNTFDIWGVQAEYGSLATPFQISTATLATELVACQRYYYRATAGANYEGYAIGMGSSATNVAALFPLKQTMRTVPSAVDYGGSIENNSPGVGAIAITAITLGDSGLNQITINCTSTAGITATRPFMVRSAGNTTSYIGFSAEL